MPKTLKHGIPPALTSHAERRLWKKKGEEEKVPNHSFQSCYEKARLHNEAKGLAMRIQNQGEDIGARQVMQSLRSDRGSLKDFPCPVACSEIAPAKPNVYTDGALKNSKGDWFSLGGAGVWWPGRKLSEKPLTEAEERYTQQREEIQGVALYSLVGGHVCSSTRTELAAAILGVSGPGPTHVASDSMAFVRKATRILKGERLTRRRSWSLQRDGDLWRTFEEACKAKGLQAIAVSNVRGYATEELVRDQKVKPEEKKETTRQTSMPMKE